MWGAALLHHLTLVYFGRQIGYSCISALGTLGRKLASGSGKLGMDNGGIPRADRLKEFCSWGEGDDLGIAQR